MEISQKPPPVLNGFRVYLRFLNSFNRDNFRQNDRHDYLRSVVLALTTLMMFIIFPIHITFDIWGMFDNRANVKKAITVFPLIVSTLQLYLSSLVMLAKNRVITEIIQQIQSIIDQRRCYGISAIDWSSSFLALRLIEAFV